MVPFRAVNTSKQQGGSTILDRMLSAIQKSFDSISAIVTNDVLIGPVAIGTGDTTITHGLGRQALTWEVVDRDAGAVVWRSPTVNARATTTIVLRASVPCNVILRFT